MLNFSTKAPALNKEFYQTEAALIYQKMGVAFKLTGKKLDVNAIKPQIKKLI